MQTDQDPEEFSRQPTPPEPPIREIAGDAIFVFNRSKPVIPEEKQRLCPQCDEFAWTDSRWCWNCKFDFDRAACSRWHPTKLLALSLIANILLAALSIYLASN